MFVKRKPDPLVLKIVAFGELVYHSTVRNLRQNHGNAIVGLLISILQTVMMVLVFYVLFDVLNIMGMRGAAVRGDYYVYLLSGVFIYMTHVKAMGAVAGSDGPTSPMMNHAPMNTLVAILSQALAALYIQVLALALLLYGYHVLVKPVEIEQPAPAALMVLMAWFTGVGVGLIFLSIKPWFPVFCNQASSLYTRINIFASGKLTPGNMLSFQVLPFFLWNPLFHIIDQTRGFVFVNYSPHHSNIAYPFFLAIGLVMLGMIAESYTRRHASLSWFARR